jgi:hypothetical protein
MGSRSSGGLWRPKEVAVTTSRAWLGSLQVEMDRRAANVARRPRHRIPYSHGPFYRQQRALRPLATAGAHLDRRFARSKPCDNRSGRRAARPDSYHRRASGGAIRYLATRRRTLVRAGSSGPSANSSGNRSQYSVHESHRTIGRDSRIEKRCRMLKNLFRRWNR